jgi:hypothetical protein
MSNSPKPRGGSNSELTRLKALWRTLADDARHFWRSRFASAEATQEQIRAELQTKLKVHLRFDSQLTAFRQWVEAQDAMDAESERQAEDDARARELHPEWSDDQRRMHVINCSLNRAISTGDFKGLGLKAVKAAQNEKVISLDRDKFELFKRKADQADATDRVLADHELSPEQREQRIKEIYGRA